MPNRKGDANERRVRNIFDDRLLWTCVRMPASGGGTDIDLPDVHLWRTDSDPRDDPNASLESQFAGEVKAFADGTRLTNEEVDALRRYARATGAKPIVIACVDSVNQHDDVGGDYVIPVDDLHSTDTGFTLRKKRDFECADPPVSLDDFLAAPWVI